MIDGEASFPTDDIAEAFDAIMAKQDAQDAAEPLELTDEAQADDGPTRDANGRFAAKEEPHLPAETQQQEKEQEAVEAGMENETGAVEAPARMPKEIREAWGELPETVRTALERREEETHKLATRVDGERQAGLQFNRVATEFRDIIERDGGGQPLAAVRNLLHTARVLRTGDATQKSALLNQLCAMYDIDIEQAYYSRPDPQIARANMELQAKNAQIASYEAEKAIQIDQSVAAAVADFRADHEHFDILSDEMSRLIEAGICKDLQTAYDRAMWSSEQLRSTLIEQQASRLADERVKQATVNSKARRAAVSPSSASGASAKPPGSANLSDIDAMRLQYDEIMARSTG